MERVERRGSIARAFSRIRTAMKRPRPAPIQITGDDHPFEITAELYNHSPTFDSTLERPTTTIDRLQTPMINLLPTTGSDPRLEPDVDDYTDNDEPLLPIAANRPGISDSKARALFSRYGLLYQMREHKSEEEPPHKLRRVERPIRIRVHWTCHACKTQFGLEKTCMECGHQRCARCSRQPSKRVQDVLETGRYLMEHSELSQQEVISSDEGSREPSVNCTPNSTPVHSAMPSPSLLLRMEPNDEVDGDIEDSPFYFPMYVRPNTALRLFGTDHNDRFEDHPRVSKLDKYSLGLGRLHKLSNGEVPMMRSVQRVYRKPRQRVRYTCKHCATLLVEGDRCRECDRNQFHRNPPKRTPPQYDVDILQIVASRLAAHGGGFAPQQELTA